MEKDGTSMGNYSISQRIERLPMTSLQRKIGFIIVMAWFFDSLDNGAMTFLLPSLTKEFGLTTIQAGLMGSMSFVGMFLGAMSSGYFSDKVGRKAILQWSMVCWGLAGFLVACSPNATILFISRILLGFGLGAEIPVAAAMLPELLPKDSRGRYVAVMEGLLPVGIICAGAIAYFVLPLVGWRWVFAIEALPAFWLLIIRRNLPESPRWLESVGRLQEADQIMTAIEQEVQRHIGRPLPPIGDAIVEVEAPKGSAFAELWSKEYRKRTIMLWILWPCALFGYYGLTTWFGSLLLAKGFSIIKSIGFIVMITSGGIFGFIAATYLIDKVGRKPVTVINLALTAVAAYFYGQAATYNTLLFFGFMLNFFQYGMWSSVYAYTPELYPTRIRGTGVGMSNSIGRVGALLGPYIMGTMMVAYGPGSVFTLAASVFAVAACSILILGPETRGKTLEEINK